MAGFVLIKPIKPKKLNEAAMRNALRHGEERVGRVLVKDFEEPVSTWEKEKPEIKVHTQVRKGAFAVSIEIEIKGEVFWWVNDGTGLWGPKHKSYEIWAGIYTGKSDKKALAFSSAFSPKTNPGSTKSGGGSRGPVNVFVAYVDKPGVSHPGIKPRDFTGQIRKKRESWWKNQMLQVLREMAKASGHQK